MPEVPPADTSPPDTSITKALSSATHRALARFRFASSDGEPRFECTLDGAAFAPCDSPQEVRVARGRHTLRVRAIDAVGNADPSPARHRWTRKGPRR